MIIRIDAQYASAAAFTLLSRSFGFPESYGKNLDALVDCLRHPG